MPGRVFAFIQFPERLQKDQFASGWKKRGTGEKQSRGTCGGAQGGARAWAGQWARQGGHLVVRVCRGFSRSLARGFAARGPGRGREGEGSGAQDWQGGSLLPPLGLSLRSTARASCVLAVLLIGLQKPLHLQSGLM